MPSKQTIQKTSTSHIEQLEHPEIKNQNVDDKELLRQVALLSQSELFEASWYLHKNKDVAKSDISPMLHYLLYGAKQGLNPSQRFDTNFYLKSNPDVEASGVNPLIHYLHSGAAEGRFPKKPSKIGTLNMYLKDLFKRPNLYLSKLPRLFTYWQKYGTKGISHLLTDKLTQKHYQKNIDIDYEGWVESFDTLTDSDYQTIQKHIETFAKKPLISVLMPIYNTSELWLRCAIESVLKQLYPYWELCIADDASTKKHVREILEEYQQKDERIKVVFRDNNGHISAASNSALDIAKGDWIALLDHDDELTKHALYLVAHEINQYPEAMFIYSDEDKIDKEGRRYDPYFKPDWNPDLFLSYNYVTHLAVYEAKLLKELGGFREGYEGSQDYDLALRFTEKLALNNIRHISHILYHWRSIAGSAAMGHNAKDYAAKAGLRAIRDHLERLDIKAEANLIPHLGTMLRVSYALPKPEPLVSIIIPTHNHYEMLKACLESIWGNTNYPNYEIIIANNQSSEAEVLDYFEKLSREEKAKILHYKQPFNYSGINNFAARAANGDVLCFLNNDIKVISEEWLTEMVSHALRSEIGAVGAKLLYPDDTIQHGGILLGIGGVAGHAHKYFHASDNGYFCRASLTQNFSAVTAACLVVEKKLYNEVGGFDEKNLTIAFNDVDFCLRLYEAGYRNLWTPYALLYHHESKTRGYEDTPEKHKRFQKEVKYMQKRWGKILYNDPAYNPNLTLKSEGLSLGKKPRINKPWLVKAYNS